MLPHLAFLLLVAHEPSGDRPPLEVPTRPPAIPACRSPRPRQPSSTWRPSGPRPMPPVKPAVG